eukprot:CAMPEP_0175044996 /NCGR_PEP_ID=MMETSP0052_2-20121109/4146_1 /TAXON_ID=51329 ORGANISM="Polytomella parva, Strain SAG 63-3" /NCGR_SAMPLE_ID=MMETSP0052_2 /ASSEMBLY_ACC=CAM_ASM_000194 /LENGTH=733 /DNA_ID=CAMNT_0016308415 /DNA_START=83 /DNA_END=2282 /DNA_ORIENTATION=+
MNENITPPLSRGCLYELVSSPLKEAQRGYYICQVIDIKAVKKPDDDSTHRPLKLAIADGIYLTTVVYNPGGEAVSSVEKGDIIAISRYVFDVVGNRPMLCILSCEVMRQYGTCSLPILMGDMDELLDVYKAHQSGTEPRNNNNNNNNISNVNEAVSGIRNSTGPSRDEMYNDRQKLQQDSQQQGGNGPYNSSGNSMKNLNNKNNSNNEPLYGNRGSAIGSTDGGPLGTTQSNRAGNDGSNLSGMHKANPGHNHAVYDRQVSGGYGGSGGYGNNDQNNQNNSNGPGGYGGGMINPNMNPSRPSHPTNATHNSNNNNQNNNNYNRSRNGPQYGGNGAVVRDDGPRYVSLQSLTPYCTRWAIRARCTVKSDLRRFNSARGEGKLFSFDLLDEEGSDIRVTAFNQEAERFFELIRLGHVYSVQHASLTQKKPQFNSTSHAYEIKLDRQSLVEEVPEDEVTRRIPNVVFNFCPISKVESVDPGAVVDVLGVIEACDPWQTITRRTGEETRKRSMTLRDDSGRSIEVTLWGNLVEDPGSSIEQAIRSGHKPVGVFKSLRVGDFNGRSLSTVGSSVVKIDPAAGEINAADEMRAWYEDGGARSACVNLSAAAAGGGGGGGMGRPDGRICFSTIKDEQLGTSGKPDYVSVLGTVDFIKTDGSSLVYPACPFEFNGRPCNKKLTEIGGGSWACERCQHGTAQPEWRFMVHLAAADHTGRQWLTAFSESGEAIFGVPAERVRE